MTGTLTVYWSSGVTRDISSHHASLWASCCSVAQSCPAPCDSMNGNMLGFLVLYYLPVCSNLCPSSWWCHPAISSSVTPLFSSPQSFPASEFSPVSQLFLSGGQSIGTSASVLPINIQGWFPLGLTGLILLSKGLSGIFSSSGSKASILWCPTFFIVQLSSIHDYWKNHSFDYTDLCWQSNVSAF